MVTVCSNMTHALASLHIVVCCWISQDLLTCHCHELSCVLENVGSARLWDFSVCRCAQQAPCTCLKGSVPGVPRQLWSVLASTACSQNRASRAGVNNLTSACKTVTVLQCIAECMAQLLAKTMNIKKISPGHILAQELPSRPLTAQPYDERGYRTGLLQQRKSIYSKTDLVSLRLGCLALVSQVEQGVCKGAMCITRVMHIICREW